MKKKVVSAVVSLAILAVLFFGLQRLVEPKYADDVPEGNFTAAYYDETTDHDVIMVGDCEVYENLDPMYLWKNYGITSYIRGNAQQLVWQSYYMLEDTLKYETPKVVIYNVQSLSYGESVREAYNRMALDGMRWSKTKYDAIQASMGEDEELLDYVFPILRYHSRITELTKSDFTYYFKKRSITHNGYYMRIDVLPLSESDVADGTWLLGDAQEEADNDDEIDDPWGDIDEEMSDGDDEIDDPWSDVDEGEESDAVSDDKYQFSDYAMCYLDKMRTLCEENGIRLILMKAPSLSPQWYEQKEAQVVAYAEKYNLDYINFYHLIDELSIDYETDTYDGGLHMNLSGADKLSAYLGAWLVENCGLTDHRSDEALAAVYEEKYQFYEEMKEAEQKELEEFGEIRSY
jgi:hypothetical protein